ncbi:MAG: type VII secretion protein EccCa [Dermatophilaceae bacterium]
MTTRLVHRPGRVTRPISRPEPRLLDAPPPVAEGGGGALPTQLVLPLLGGLTSVTMMVVMRNGQKIFLLIAAVVLVVALATGLFMVLSSRGQQLRQRAHARDLYLDHLERLRVDLDAQRDAALAQAQVLHPPTHLLPTVLRSPARLWERRGGDPDFGLLRVGVADQPWLALTLPGPQSPTQPHDPALLAQTELLVAEMSVVPDLPVVVDLDSVGTAAIVGPRQDCLYAARTLLAHAAAWHCPDDLHIALVVPPAHVADWAGVDQLPHLIAGRLVDGPVPARRIAPTLPALARLLGSEIVDRLQAATTQRRAGGGRVSLPTRLLVVVDGESGLAPILPSPDPELTLADLGITVLHLVRDRLEEPGDVGVRLTLRPDGGVLENPGGHEQSGPRSVGGIRVDRTGHDTLVALARHLAPLRLTRTVHQVSDGHTLGDVFDLLGFASVDRLVPEQLWQPRSATDFLRVPLGYDDHGVPLSLDLKESAQLGMGPHGICIGATGSGKSELLRTIILGLALHHPPEDLAMILVDYKGGAAFSPFATLPHVAGLIDNLADDAQLTERARQSIQGEVVRRQQQLKDAGHLSSIGHYRRLRATDRPDLAPMPHLFVVIDEFGELLTAEPEFTDLFLQIGRIGRSIGVHLLLSSQRIEAGRLRGLDTYLSYRIGLRTFSEAESQVVLETKDAFHLPPLPGYGYLKVDTSVYQRFRAGYVSGRVDPEPVPDEPLDDERPQPLLLPTYNTIAAGQGSDAAEVSLQPPAFEVERTLVEATVERLRVAGRDVRPVWLPPLPERMGLDRVVGEPRHTDLGAIMGLVDDPTHQDQSAWVLDLARSGGHVAVIGAPQSGRTTVLRTLAVSLALTHRPEQVSIYGMDATGSGLARIEGFPHVGGVATRAHGDRMRRLIEELNGMLAERERAFQSLDVDSLEQLRRLHAQGRLPRLPSADVVVLIDGFGTLRSDFEELMDPLGDLIAKGGSFGIHFVVTLNRWGDLRIAQQTLFGTRIELRLNDPSDSILDRKLSQTLTADRPGRAITGDKLFAHVALPVLEEVPNEDLAEALEALATRSRAAHSGPGAAPIRLLPLHLPADQLWGAHVEPESIPFGQRQDSMDNALWELLGADQHLLVFGDARCGKSTLLRTLARGLVARFTDDELIIAVMDTRGTVPPAIPEDHLGGHAPSVREARGLALAIAKQLQMRASTPAAERAGHPRIVLLVDDYDILDAGGANPLEPLVPHLPSARDLAFHVVLTRPVSGVNRALFGHTLQAIRDTSGSLFVMSGDRSEGQIVPGIRAQQLPPGRGQFLRRAEPPFLVQVAMDPPQA